MATFSLKDQSYDLYEFHQGEERHIPNFYFDLASLTKPLTLGAFAAKKPQCFTDEKLLMLEHRAGIPAWAILGRSDWQDTVNKFPIKQSDALYSDLSMLRLMLTIEKEEGRDLESLCSFYWDKELLFWKNLPEHSQTPDTGFRNKEVINGVVNDDNCYKLDRFCSHAGLFGTLEGVTKSILNLEQSIMLCEFMTDKMQARENRRFVWGWDTVSNPLDTLAGTHAPKNTFGHLGFTGTSIWIDSDSGKGWVLLTNATKKYWYHRKGLNEVRKSLGAIIWKNL